MKLKNRKPAPALQVQLIPTMTIDVELTGDATEIYNLSKDREFAFSRLDTYRLELDDPNTSLQDLVGDFVTFGVMPSEEFEKLVEV